MSITVPPELTNHYPYNASAYAFLQQLREAIFRLEDDYREPLVLQVLLGHSTKEIAELMGMQQGAILTRLHRARLKLKDVVDREAAE